jgi:protease IV
MKKTAVQIKSFLQKSLQVFLNLWGIAAKVVGSIVLILWIIMFSLILSIETDEEILSKGKVIREGGESEIAVIKLNGEIMMLDDQSTLLNYNPFVITPARTREIFTNILEDEAIKGVVLYINSPGGSVVASEEIYKQIIELKKQKPVVAVMGEVAASGGYYLAVACDQIVASPATITGSLGTVIMAPNVSQLADNLGVGMQVYKSGQFKDMGSMFRDATEEEKAIFNQMVSDANQMFIDVIVAGRKMEEAEVVRLADGRVYSGKQAADVKLVDELGDIDTGIEIVSDVLGVQDPTVLDYSTPGFLDSLLGMSSKKIGLESNFDQLIPQRKMGLYYLWN